MSPVAGAIRLATMTVVYAALMFGIAGTIDWPGAWGYLVLMTASLVGYTTILARVHPDLIDERSHPPGDAARWDRPYVFVIGVLGPIALVVVAGLDRRFRWTEPFPIWLTLFGLLFAAVGGVLTNWAVASNRFFSALVRIQRDRGHVVVDDGPYRCVRHPGYLASVLTMIGAPVAMGSFWALIVSAVIIVTTIARTAREDQFLHDQLQGYADYAARVPRRLFPGIW